MKDITPPALVIEAEASLADLARDINAAHQEAEGACRASVQHALEAGRLLLEAKKRVGHGGWLPWLRENVQVAERTVQAYTRLAKRWSTVEAKAQRVADLTFREALALLVEADTESEPDAAPVPTSLLPPVILTLPSSAAPESQGPAPATAEGPKQPQAGQVVTAAAEQPVLPAGVRSVVVVHRQEPPQTPVATVRVIQEQTQLSDLLHQLVRTLDQAQEQQSLQEAEIARLRHLEKSLQEAEINNLRHREKPRPEQQPERQQPKASPAGKGDKLLVTVDEAAKMLSLGRTLVYALMERGELRYAKFGKARRIPVEAIHEVLNKNMIGPDEAK